MWRQFAFGVIWGVFVGLGVCVEVEVSIDKETSGFFMKPMFRGQDQFSNISVNSLERPLVVTKPRLPVTVQAKYGPFTVEEGIPPALLHGGGESTGSIPEDSGLDVSAHLVSQTVTQERPQVTVLFHAAPLLDTDQNRIKVPRNPVDISRWCAQIHTEYRKEEVTSVCVVSDTDNVCVADALLPQHWWHPSDSVTINVYYSYFRMDKSGQCRIPSSGTPVYSDIILPSALKDSPDSPQKSAEESKGDSIQHTYIPPQRMFLSSASLTHGQITYQELKEDQHILVYIPQKSFYPGSKFTVPIKLQAESDLQIFVIRVRARHGIRIVDAIPSDASRWDVTLEMSHKSKGAMVTASVADTRKYSKTDRVQNIFDFVFEVESDATGEERGRLAFTLTYEMNTKQREVYGSVENKVVARIDIQHDNTIAIVPVVKNSELINTAMLSGKLVSEPMRIYSISQTAKVTDITSTTTCHSGDETVLKVSESCDLVYLDGNETKGSASVSIIAKYGRHSEFLFFHVWAPEFPLDIQLSDDKLSQIKRWKVPIDTSNTRKERGVDFGLLTHTDLLLHDDSLRGEDTEGVCRLRYQQSEVEVYTRFVVGAEELAEYYVHRKALFRVTDLVLDRLRVADVSVARLTRNIVEGLQPGRTEIQVVTRKGRVIGAGEVRVGKGKVTIMKLDARVVTGLSLTLDREPQMDGVLKANVHRKTELHHSYQEGFLDITVRFDDGTSMPLHQVTRTDYLLETDSLNSHIATFGPRLSEDVPRVIALGSGKGELLKVALELSDACHKKKSPNVALSYAYISIKFQDTPLLKDMGHYGTQNNRVNERYGQQDMPDDSGKIFLSKDEFDQLGKNRGSAQTGYHDSDGIHGILVDDLDFPNAKHGEDYSPNPEAQQQLVYHGGMTPLEIGMYVLLAIFCVAIVVFMVNCMIFVTRYKRKRKPKEMKDPVSNVNDWVWIGRATLERNAISTTCSQALMPDSDFNGNHNNLQYLGAQEPPVSCRNSAVTESNSNRNSVISTYKGAECNIRITANPLLGDADNTDDDVIEEDISSSCRSTLDRPGKVLVPPPVPPHAPSVAAALESQVQSSEGRQPEPRLLPPQGRAPENRASVPVASSSKAKPAAGLSRASCPGSFGFSSDSDDMGSLGRDYFQEKDSPKPGPSRLRTADLPELEGACALDKEASRQVRREAFQAALAESIKAQQDSANGNLAASGNVSEAEWDYELMGLTYDQLLDYFDNLKESTA